MSFCTPPAHHLALHMLAPRAPPSFTAFALRVPCCPAAAPPRTPGPRRSGAGCATAQGTTGVTPCAAPLTHLRPFRPRAPTSSPALCTLAQAAPPGRPAQEAGCHVPRRLSSSAPSAPCPSKGPRQPASCTRRHEPTRTPPPFESSPLGVHLDAALLASEGRAFGLARGKVLADPLTSEAGRFRARHGLGCLWPLQGRAPAPPSEALTRPVSCSAFAPSQISVPNPPERSQRVLERLRVHPPADQALHLLRMPAQPQPGRPAPLLQRPGNRPQGKPCLAQGLGFADDHLLVVDGC